jgi:hypothetical protein
MIQGHSEKKSSFLRFYGKKSNFIGAIKRIKNNWIRTETDKTLLKAMLFISTRVSYYNNV